MTTEEIAMHLAQEYGATKANKESAIYRACIRMANEQKAIDDAELARLKKAWEKEAEVNHDTAMAYKQGYHDAIDKACKWLRWIMKTGSSYGEFPSEESIKDFRKAMEESL